MGPGPHADGGDSTPARPHESGFWPRMFCRVERALLEVRIPCRVGWARCAAHAVAAAFEGSCGSSLAGSSTALHMRGGTAFTLAPLARVSHLASAVRNSSSCDAMRGAVGRGEAGWGGSGWGGGGSHLLLLHIDELDTHGHRVAHVEHLWMFRGCSGDVEGMLRGC